MAQGIPSTNAANFSTTEAAQFKTKLGLPVSLGGLIYSQYGASTSIANTTTATTVFKPSVAQGSLVIPAGALAWAGAPQAGLAYSNVPGCTIRVKLVGTAKTNGTPNLTLTAGFIQGASTYTAYSTSGAVALVSTASALPMELDVIYQIQAVGAASTASVLCGGWYRYVSATTVANFFQLPWTVTTATLDTSLAAQVEIQATSGAADANNQFNVLGAWVYMDN